MPRLTRLPRVVRQRLTARLLTIAGRRVVPRQPRALVLWPPVRTAGALDDLRMRVQWFLPRDRFDVPVFIPVDGSVDLRRVPSDGVLVRGPEKARVHYVPPAEGRRHMRSEDVVVLLHDVVTAAAARFVANESAPFFVVDPTLFFTTEMFEWLRFYHAFRDAGLTTELREISGRNLRRLLRTAGGAPWIDVCGSGPGLGALLHGPGVTHRALIGNQTIKSKALTDRLKPLAVAFLSPIDFSPARYSADFRAHVRRCVEEYGSCVLVPGGYEAVLLATNCHDLREHMIALEPVSRLTYPTPERVEASQTNDNVLTALMLPLAHGLRPQRLRIWGCDGIQPGARPRDRRDAWNYLPGLEQDRHLGTDAHPAYFRDQGRADPSMRAYYARHCAEVARLIEYIEQQGLPVDCCSPSFIPALHARERLSVEIHDEESALTKGAV
jgi:hypothetical protein